jgi:probable F420-dependent oxidoreductase
VKFDVELPGHKHMPGVYEWAWDFGPTEWRRIAREADELGYASLLVCEHVAMPTAEVPRLGSYWPDALSMMTFLAASTERIRIDSALLVAPYHHPLQLANALATIDVLSGGRVNVTVGVGHAAHEFDALGLSFADRGAITDETLQALEALWSSPAAEYHGRFFDIAGVTLEPQPVQRPRPPILVGGNSRPALRRAARYDGWQANPTNTTLDQLIPNRDYVLEQRAQAGATTDFEITWLESPDGLAILTSKELSSESRRRAWAEQLVEAVQKQFIPFGITRATVPIPEVGGLDEYLEYLRWFAAEVTPLTGAS